MTVKLNISGEKKKFEVNANFDMEKWKAYMSSGPGNIGCNPNNVELADCSWWPTIE